MSIYKYQNQTNDISVDEPINLGKGVGPKNLGMWLGPINLGMWVGWDKCTTGNHSVEEGTPTRKEVDEDSGKVMYTCSNCRWRRLNI